MQNKPISPSRLEERILLVRSQKVMLDTDLAALYGVETRALNQAVKRNRGRFPADFMFQLSVQEFDEWRSQIVMSNPGARMGLRRAPFAFTEHGALMAATVLNSPRAVEMSLFVVRTFMRMREVLATHKALAAQLAALEQQTTALALKHDVLAGSTRAQFKQVIEQISCQYDAMGRRTHATPPTERWLDAHNAIIRPAFTRPLSRAACALTAPP